MGNGDAEQRITPPHHHYNIRGSGAAHSHPFSVGSPVEVRTNGKHFEGVFFSATVVAPPISLRKKITTPTPKNPNRIYVEYRDRLVRKDRLGPLREYVDFSCIRPKPPSQEVTEGFQRNDVVDAFHLGGWRKGVVSCVAEGGERLVVRFENLPDEDAFPASMLRAHWDWVDGVWVRSKMQGGVVFEAGMKVEVWFTSGDEYHGAWYPATLVQDLGNGSFIVELKYNDGDCVRSEVDCYHVRPRPPHIKDWKFQASERVNAFHNFGWWSGVISEENGYTVVVFLEHWRSTRVFLQSDLRPRMDWMDGKWSIGFDHHKATPSSTKKRKRGKAFTCVSDSGCALKKPANQETKIIAFQVEDDVDNDVGFDEEVERFAFMLDEDCNDSEALHASGFIDEGHTSAEEGNERQSWPFVKCSEVWKALESMEVFKKMPQKPHFKPLEYFKESLREGFAVACMVTFTNLVERICRIKMSDPKCVADGIKETLLDLEAQGFDVGTVQECVREFMAAKDEEERLVHMVKEMKAQIEEYELRRNRIKKVIRGVKENVRRLQKQLVSSEMARAVEVDGIGKLQSELKLLTHQECGVWF